MKSKWKTQVFMKSFSYYLSNKQTSLMQLNTKQIQTFNDVREEVPGRY